MRDAFVERVYASVRSATLLHRRGKRNPGLAPVAVDQNFATVQGVERAVDAQRPGSQRRRDARVGAQMLALEQHIRLHQSVRPPSGRDAAPRPCLVGH